MLDLSWKVKYRYLLISLVRLVILISKSECCVILINVWLGFNEINFIDL